MRRDGRWLHNFIFFFQVENGLFGKNENIEYLWRYAADLLHSFTVFFWENNGLLNKNYWDHLDIIDQGHSKGNVSQFFSYLGYPWTNFNQISITMMEGIVAGKKSLIIWPWKCRTMSPFTKKIAVSQKLYERFISNFHRNDVNMAGNKNFISADLKNVGQDHLWEKWLHLGFYTTDFNQTFTKMAQLRLAAKAKSLHSCHLASV